MYMYSIYMPIATYIHVDIPCVQAPYLVPKPNRFGAYELFTSMSPKIWNH